LYSGPTEVPCERSTATHLSSVGTTTAWTPELCSRSIHSNHGWFDEATIGCAHPVRSRWFSCEESIAIDSEQSRLLLATRC
jgi:hypothetical protein